MNLALARELWTYDRDTGVLCWRISPAKNIPAGATAGSRDADGYLQVSYKGKKYKVHRIAWLLTEGFLPPEVDHRNRKRDENQFDNLRPATRKQNAENTGSRRGGFRGVYWFPRTQRWVVHFKHNAKQKNLGYFPCLLDAVATRIRAEREHYTHSTHCGN